MLNIEYLELAEMCQHDNQFKIKKFLDKEAVHIDETEYLNLLKIITSLGAEKSLRVVLNHYDLIKYKNIPPIYFMETFEDVLSSKSTKCLQLLLEHTQIDAETFYKILEGNIWAFKDQKHYEMLKVTHKHFNKWISPLFLSKFSDEKIFNLLLKITCPFEEIDLDTKFHGMVNSLICKNALSSKFYLENTNDEEFKIMYLHFVNVVKDVKDLCAIEEVMEEEYRKRLHKKITNSIDNSNEVIKKRII